jgi:uncharacterized FlaG/YvyC family protein
MDTQAVNSTGNPTVPPTKTQSSSSRSESKTVPTSDLKAIGDTVDLSFKAKALINSKSVVQASINKVQKKFSVTDNNDVIIQVIDPKTHKVVKSIPTEEQIQLKKAVRDGISDILK